MTKHQSILYSAGAALVAGALLLAGTALASGPTATSSTDGSIQGGVSSGNGSLQGSVNAAFPYTDNDADDAGASSSSHTIIGTITAVNGTTLTIASKHWFAPFVKDETKGSASMTMTYSVNAANATITSGYGKDATTSSIASLALGDTIIARGTLSGTTLTASSVRDIGIIPKPPVRIPLPILFGTVSAVNGTSLTVDGKTLGATATSTYSVDASGAKVWGIATSSKPAIKSENVSDIQVGDHVVVRGAVNGTAVTASTIVDGTFAKKLPGGFKAGFRFFSHGGRKPFDR